MSWAVPTSRRRSRERPAPGGALSRSEEQREVLDRIEAGGLRALIEGPPRAGELGELVAAWEAMGEGDPGRVLPGLRVLLARLEGRRDQPGEARLHAHVVLALGVASVLAGQGDGGAILLERALELMPGGWPRAQALRFSALALEQRGALLEAARRYEEAALAYAPLGNPHGEGSAWYGAAAALAARGEEEAALPLAERGVRRLRESGRPGPLAAALALEANLLLRRDPPRALAALDEALARGARSGGMFAWEVHLRRAEALLALGRPDEAERCLARAAPPGALSMGDQAALENLRARILRARGRPAEALDALRTEAGLPGTVELERAALRLMLAAERGEVELGSLDRIDLLLRAGWRRAGVAEGLAAAAERLLEDAEHRGPAEPAARAWQLALAAGAPLPEGVAERLVRLGAPAPLGPLLLERVLGRGGMGEVWLARHREGGEVAVKLLHQGGVGAVDALHAAELRALARLDHPHIVRVLAAFPVDALCAAMLRAAGGPSVRVGAPALVMERVLGGALDEQAPLATWTEARALLTALLQALAQAHARGVLHLDIKPGNVLLDRVDGQLRPRLSDFGLTGLGLHDAGRGRMGTPAFMAPEQATLGEELTPATDLYALGCLAWWLVCGAAPYDGATAAQILARHRAGLLPPLVPRFPVPVGLGGWLQGLLARRAWDRFACAADARAALEALGEAEDRGPVPWASPARSLPTLDLPDSGRTLPLPVEETAPPDIHAHGAPPPARLPPAPMPALPPALPPGPPPLFLLGAGEGLLPFRRPRLVGRDAERAALWSRLAEVRAVGRGRLVWIEGAPGLGRSALMRGVAESAVVAGAAWIRSPGRRPPPADRPHLLLLDDREPEEVLRLALPLMESPVLVLACGPRPPEAPGEVLPVGPLPEPALRALLDQLLPLDQLLRAELVARAAGSPALAVVLLEELVRRDALQPGAQGFQVRPGAGIALPEDLRSLWQERLDGLAPPGGVRRSSWELLAVLGLQAALADWQRAAQLAGLVAAPELLDPLVEPGWARVQAGRVRFLDPALREALLAGARESGRAALWHGAVADALPPGTQDRGMHLALAGRHAEALGPLRRQAAAEVNASRLTACQAVLDRLEASLEALGTPPDHPMRAEALVVRAHLALHLRADPLPYLEDGLRFARGGVRVQLLYTRGWVLGEQGRPAEAEAAFRIAEAAARENGQAELLRLIRLGLAGALFAQGQDARHVLDELEPTLREDPELWPRLLACRGRGLLRLGEGRAAVQVLEEALRGARAVGAPDVEAEILADLAERAAQEGDPEEARRRLVEALEALGPTGSEKARRLRERLARLGAPVVARAPRAGVD